MNTTTPQTDVFSVNPARVKEDWGLLNEPVKLLVSYVDYVQRALKADKDIKSLKVLSYEEFKEIVL